MKIALAPYTLREYLHRPASAGSKFEIKSLLQRVRSIGYDGIEMGTPEGFTVARVEKGRLSTHNETYGFQSVDPHNT